MRRRRRLTLLSSVAGGAVAAAAAVTAALVLAAPAAMMPALDPSRLPGVSTPALADFVDAPAFTTTYRGYDAGPYIVSDPDLVTTAYQQSTIDTPMPQPAIPAMSASATSPSASPTSARTKLSGLARGGTLVVYRSGAFSPREFSPSEEVALRAGTGMLHYAGGMTSPSLAPGDLARAEKLGVTIPALAWQYTANSWAAIYWSSWETTPTRDELVTIADGLKPARPKEFPIGFVPKFVPKGYTMMAASFGQDMLTGDRIVSSARLTLKPPPTPVTRPFALDEWAMLTLAMGTGDPSAKVIGKPQCSDDRTECALVVAENGTYLRADTGGVKPPTLGEPSQILLGMTAQDPEDKTGWPPATQVFATP